MTIAITASRNAGAPLMLAVVASRKPGSTEITGRNRESVRTYGVVQREADKMHLAAVDAHGIAPLVVTMLHGGAGVRVPRNAEARR
jgi:hypothetical protein